MAKKEIKLTKITLETADGKSIELTPNEAKELHAQLDALFGEKTQYVESPTPVVIRERWPYRGPWWSEPVYGTSHPNRFEVTCKSDSGLMLCAQGNK